MKKEIAVFATVTLARSVKDDIHDFLMEQDPTDVFAMADDLLEGKRRWEDSKNDLDHGDLASELVRAIKVKDYPTLDAFKEVWKDYDSKVTANKKTTSGLYKVDHHKINKSLLSEPRENMIKFCDKTWGVSENRRNRDEYLNGKDELTNSQLSQMVIEWASMHDLNYGDLKTLWTQIVGSPMELPNDISGLSRRELLNLAKEELVEFIIQSRG